MPDLAYCLQLGGLGASRQQEVQRVGRVQRYKPDGRTSQFHTVVTQQQECHELEYTDPRNAHLLDQGYHLREVPAHKVLIPIPARLNARLSKYARQFHHKLCAEMKASIKNGSCTSTQVCCVHSPTRRCEAVRVPKCAAFTPLQGCVRQHEYPSVLRSLPYEDA